MALDTKQFSKVNTWLQAPTDAAFRNREEFRCVSADTAAQATAAGYFNTVRQFLQVGDIILVLASNGFRFLVVATVPADGTDVTTTNVAAV